MSGKAAIDRTAIEQRLRSRGLRMPAEDLEPFAELVAMLDAAAEVVRAPLPVAAEPANVLMLPRTS
jgi:hypothetical protein